MTEHPLIVKKGRHAGLYVPLDGQFAYVKDETRPYAPPFNNIISHNGFVFFTWSPATFVTNPAYSVAPRSAQDEYAYSYQGYTPYCNGVVHSVKNRLTTEYIIITPEELYKILYPIPPESITPISTNNTPPKTPPNTPPKTPPKIPPKIPVYKNLDDPWPDRVYIDDLLYGLPDF